MSSTPASRTWQTRAAAGKERGAGQGDGAGRRRWAGSGEVGVASSGSARGCAEVATPRGGDKEGGKGRARVRRWVGFWACERERRDRDVGGSHLIIHWRLVRGG
jgi:hypothetical protein